MPTSKGSLIAIVDDDPSIRSALSRLLRSHDFQCVVFDSPKNALADPTILDAQCLILDIQLPGMDGIELRKKLEEAGCHTPCLFITGQIDTASSKSNLRLAGSPCLMKPFDESQLLATIEWVLSGDGSNSLPTVVA